MRDYRAVRVLGMPASSSALLSADSVGLSQFLAEAANGPTTPEADLILRERDIPVLPDIYTSCGARPCFTDAPDL